MFVEWRPVPQHEGLIAQWRLASSLLLNFQTFSFLCGEKQFLNWNQSECMRFQILIKPLGRGEGCRPEACVLVENFLSQNSLVIARLVKGVKFRHEISRWKYRVVVSPRQLGNYIDELKSAMFTQSRCGFLVIDRPRSDPLLRLGNH